MKSVRRNTPKSPKRPRVIARQRSGNHTLPPGIEPPPEPGWPDSDTPIESPDRDQECAGCALLAVRVAALETETKTLLESLGNHQAMLADLNARLSSQEWGRVREAQGVARKRRRPMLDAGDCDPLLS